ncbi:MAG TPA: TlpA disulfide reductase family protein [Nitrospiria bacterium]|nr:TlpA disulfide reductase family protein [Nitrospiria bacterium]
MDKRKAIVLFLSVLIFFATSMAQGAGPGEKAPDFTGKTLLGKNIKLSELRGRIVLINFWGTWCAPCKEELPYFNRLYGKFKGVGLEILAVNIDKVASQAARMSGTLGLSFPVVLDPAGDLSDLYRIRSMPTTFVVGKDGMIRYVHWGFGPNDPARYEAEIRSLLKDGS